MIGTLSRLFDSIWYRNHPLQWLLRPLGFVYRIAASARRALYRRGLLRSVAVGVPVVVVGNLSVGGTGKTPCVIWLARRLRERGYRPGVICRGYRGRAVSWPQQVGLDSDAAVVGDEAVVLARRSGCPVAAGPARAAAAAALIERHGVDVLVSDDGLQHYRLARDVEIAVVDGRRGLGNGRCLPAGPLREPAQRLRHVDAVIVNGCGWEYEGAFRARIAPALVRQTCTGATRKLADFEGQRVHAVAGIGNPQRFFELLEEHGISVEPHPLPDHAEISAADLEFATPGIVMITEKDEVKCHAIAHDGVWCVVADLEFTAADAERLLQVVLRRIDRGAL